MIRFLIVCISLLTLPSCGADGTPMRPTASGTVTVTPSGVRTGGSVGVSKGPVSIGISL
jgi:hypothetical protein